MYSVFPFTIRVGIPNNMYLLTICMETRLYQFMSTNRSKSDGFRGYVLISWNIKSANKLYELKLVPSIELDEAFEYNQLVASFGFALFKITTNRLIILK